MGSNKVPRLNGGILMSPGSQEKAGGGGQGSTALLFAIYITYAVLFYYR